MAEQESESDTKRLQRIGPRLIRRLNTREHGWPKGTRQRRKAKGDKNWIQRVLDAIEGRHKPPKNYQPFLH